MLEFKGGRLGTEELTVDQIKAIARLPARDVLYAQLVGTVGSPITGLVRGLNALIAGVAIQLQQVVDQGLIAAGEPEEAAAAEPETAPAESEQSGAEAGEAPAESEQPAAESEQPAAEAEEAPAESEQPGAEAGEAPAESEEPAAEASEEVTFL